MKKLNFITRILNNWAYRSKLRVFVCGTGGTTCEWDSLRSSFYADLRPSIYRIYDANEADLIVLHGPLSDATLERLEEMLKVHPLPVAGVGSQLRMDEQGYLMKSTGELSRLKLSAVLLRHMPEPHELQVLAVEAVANV
jgi:hypothetical protein